VACSTGRAGPVSSGAATAVSAAAPLAAAGPAASTTVSAPVSPGWAASAAAPKIGFEAAHEKERSDAGAPAVTAAPQRMTAA